MNVISFPALGIKFNIDPIAVHYKNGGGIYWYGIIIAVGLGVYIWKNNKVDENKDYPYTELIKDIEKNKIR